MENSGTAFGEGGFVSLLLELVVQVLNCFVLLRKNRKALNREHELLKDVIRAMEERGNLGGLGPTTWTVRHERLG